MALTSSQLAAIKTFDAANYSTLSEHEAAAAFNAIASPAYFVWRTSASKHEYTNDTGVGDDGVAATNFVWGGATGGYINRSQGERDAFKELFNSVLSCNPSRPNVRTAFDDIFSGAGAGAVANRAHVRAIGRRTVTVAEKLFVTATVGGPTQTGARGSRTNPDTLGFEGELTAQDVIDARNS